jgi:AraC family transcriptional regulator, regulatory protein of adaptative response / methylated-DNA-[protein]-cysteine methyltransferase
MEREMAAPEMALRDSASIDHDTAWRAVLARDARQDGRLIYAVSSTGIFCRPSCPSRRPRRSNVAFFAEPVAARAAGFRPCRRCRPEEAAPSSLEARVRAAQSYLDAHAGERVTLRRLADATGTSPHHLQRAFKRLVGLSPREYAQARRADRLRSLLESGESVSAATYAAGFGSSSRVYEGSDAQLGMTPGAYRRGGRGVRIRFTIVPCPLGQLLVAGTERGVCAVMLGDADAALEQALAARFPAATHERAGVELDEWVSAVLNGLDGRTDAAAPPLDVQATEFQWRVWRALGRIPAGETRTYREVAAQIGRPSAVRAVGGACADNPVALIIPCHRVVRSDGGLGGYAWGIERKRRLLDRERDASNPRSQAPTSRRSGPV